MGFDQSWYIQPTVFADVDNAHTIAREEIFGPVLISCTSSALASEPLLPAK